MKIISDSSIMFSIEEGARRGIDVLPLSVSIDHETWLEYEEISTEAFLERVRAGALPKSSCPPPSMILEHLDTNEETVVLSMADGLSGSYGVACGMREQAHKPENVHVVNTKTLCIPHRAIALCAVELAKTCQSAGEVAQKAKQLADKTHSYLVPADFDFLRRGGRLTPLAAKVAHIIKAAPVMVQTEDGTRLEKLSIARSFKKAVGVIASDMRRHGVSEGHFIGISHAGDPKSAHWALEKLQELFPACEMGVFNLGPAFITQGGPGCIAIQSIDLRGFGKVDLS